MSLWPEAKDWKIEFTQAGSGFCIRIEARCYSQESLGALMSTLQILKPMLSKKPVPLPLPASAYKEGNVHDLGNGHSGFCGGGS